jgi:hypothetical protein
MADNTSVRNNSPDPRRYHTNAPGQPPGTMLPLARPGTDGRSFGFDHNVPQEVIVDPGEDGGGFKLDMSALSGMKASFNAAAVTGEAASDPSTFLKRVSKTMSKKVASTPKLKTGSKKSIQGKSALRQAPPPPSLSSLVDNEEEPDFAVDVSNAIDSMIEEAEFEASQPSFEDETAAIDSELAALRLKLAAAERRKKAATASPDMTSQIAAIVRAVLSEQEVVTPKEPLQSVQPVEVVTPFDSLSIPFLKSDKAERPKFETYFELGKFGTMAARYHTVAEGKDCLALVYDTRFEDGFQYLPPNLGEESISISVPQLNKSWNCNSFGLHYTLGCLDVVILLTTSESKQ